MSLFYQEKAALSFQAARPDISNIKLFFTNDIANILFIKYNRMYIRNDHTKKEDKDMRTQSEKKLEQIQAVKKRLYQKYNQFTANGGTLYALHQILNNEQDFELNYDTLRKTLNPDSTTLDFFCVLALCRYWKLDTAYILSSPENTEMPMPSAESMTDSIKFKVLDDPAYLGTYYGFLFSNKKDNSDLHRLCLKIELSQDGSFAAALTVESSVVGQEGVRPLKKELHGVPILSTFNSNISITLTDDIGNFFFLYMNYQKYITPRVFYRKGIAVTSAATDEREPVMQSFVLFDRPVPEEKLCFIPGLLFPPQDSCPITEESLRALKEGYPIVAQLTEEFDYMIKEHRETVYDINEASILAEKSSMSKEDRLKALALLKEKALAANQFFFSSNLTESAGFVRDYLLRP